MQAIGHYLSVSTLGQLNIQNVHLNNLVFNVFSYFQLLFSVIFNVFLLTSESPLWSLTLVIEHPRDTSRFCCSVLEATICSDKLSLPLSSLVDSREWTPIQNCPYAARTNILGQNSYLGCCKGDIPLGTDNCSCKWKPAAHQCKLHAPVLVSQCKCGREVGRAQNREWNKMGDSTKTQRGWYRQLISYTTRGLYLASRVHLDLCQQFCWWRSKYRCNLITIQWRLM